MRPAIERPRSHLLSAVTLGLVSLCACGISTAADSEPNPFVGFRVAFGKSLLDTLPALAAGLQQTGADDVRHDVLSFSLASGQLSAYLGGAPIAQYRFRVDEAAGTAEETPGSNTWIWLTAGSVAVIGGVVALAAGTGGGGSTGSTGSSQAGVACGGSIAGQPNHGCVVPCPGGSTGSCVGFEGAHFVPSMVRDDDLSWLNDNTGHMGDLVAQ